MSLNRKQIRGRLQSIRWQIPGLQMPVDLLGEGKRFMSYTLLNKMINDAISEWCLENNVDKEEWTLDDGSGGEGTLTADQRRYTLPSDVGVVTEAKVAYDDTTGFLGYPLILVDEPFLDGTLRGLQGNVLNLGVNNIYRWVYGGTTALALTAAQSAALTAGTLTINFADLGADSHGNTPPTFDAAPVFPNNPSADVDRDIIVTAVTTTGFTIKGGVDGPNPPMNLSFSFEKPGGANQASQNVNALKGIPERMFIWKDEFWLDPIPNNTYTLRMFGYHFPNNLTTEAGTPDAWGPYHESIFLKAKVFVGRELNVLNEAQLRAQYEDLKDIVMSHDIRRHHAVRITNANSGGYW